MKHLRKYNESIENRDEILYYIKECFADFYDDEQKYDVEEDGEYYDRLAIMINLPSIENPWQTKDIKDFVDWANELNDFFLDIQVAINRVKDKYSNIEVKVEEDSFQENVVDGRPNQVVTIKYIRIYFIIK